MTSKWMERFEQSYVFIELPPRPAHLQPEHGVPGQVRPLPGEHAERVPAVALQHLPAAEVLPADPEQMDELYGLGDPIWQNYWTMAVIDSTNLLMQQLSTPSAGYHGKEPVRHAGCTCPRQPAGQRPHRDRPPRPRCIAPMKLNVRLHRRRLRAARPRPQHVHASTTRPATTTSHRRSTRSVTSGTRRGDAALTTSETNFLGVDRGSDALAYSLPYYMTFNKELAPLFGACGPRTTAAYAASLVKLGDGTARVLPPHVRRAARTTSTGSTTRRRRRCRSTTTATRCRWTKVEADPAWGTRFYARVSRDGVLHRQLQPGVRDVQPGLPPGLG